jgi:hypothetical protein
MTSSDGAGMAILRPRPQAGTISRVEDIEATQLVLEALFDIKAAVYDIRDVLIEPPEDDDEASEEDDA